MRYDIHPGVAMIRKWADELPAKTGRTLDQWAEVVRAADLPDRKARVALLKGEYGLGTMTAEQAVEYAADRHTWDGDPDVYLEQAARYVDGMFAGPKAGLRPVFDAVVRRARALGRDVKVCPCKTIVPFYRARVFAELKPATRTRLELSLALGEVPFGGPLVPNPRAKGNDRLRHQVHLAAPADVTAEVVGWLRAAYAADA
ncbi:MAG: hypothetical protein C0501_04300 [Isosphaera sp.]|nr:hypothetical protein [Isosphaera sp.]